MRPPKRILVPIFSLFPVSSSLSLETTNLLPVCICLLWTFHRNEFMQNVAFCVWLLLLSMFERVIHVVACISSFLRLNNIPLYEYSTFCLSIHPLMAI